MQKEDAKQFQELFDELLFHDDVTVIEDIKNFLHKTNTPLTEYWDLLLSESEETREIGRVQIAFMIFGGQIKEYSRDMAYPLMKEIFLNHRSNLSDEMEAELLYDLGLCVFYGYGTKINEEAAVCLFEEATDICLYVDPSGNKLNFIRSALDHFEEAKKLVGMPYEELFQDIFVGEFHDWIKEDIGIIHQEGKRMSAFDQIIGYENIKEELKWYSDILKNPKKYKALGVSGPSGLLLYGEPGVGKSLMAKCFITESGRKTNTIRKNLPNGDFVKEIKNIFDEATANAPSIVFLDDVDKFANCDYDHTDAEEYVTIQACMDECKGKDVFVIATANDEHYLPDSLRRKGRFDKELEVDIPTLKEAEAIIRFYLKDKKVVGQVDCSEIANLLEGYSCATLESVINEAGIFAGYEGRKKIQREDIVQSCIRFLFGNPFPKESRFDDIAGRVALHEAGHVVVAEVLERNSVVASCIGLESGKVGGFTKTRRENNYYFFKEKVENQIICTLGGRAAVEIMEGAQDIGSSKDINYAYSEVKDFIHL